jgi:hypothetical protein
MVSILAEVRFSVKEKLRKQLRHCRVAAVRLRDLMIVNLFYKRRLGTWQRFSVFITPRSIALHSDSASMGNGPVGRPRRQW